MKIDSLQHAHASDVTSATVLPSEPVPENMQRGIYWLKVVNKTVGGEMTLDVKAIGVGTTTIDKIQFTTNNETQEFSFLGGGKLIPIYKLRSGQKLQFVPSTGTCHISLLYGEAYSLDES